MNRTWVSYGLALCLLAAACADRPPESGAVESKTSELVLSDVGQLMPYGGFEDKCVAVDQGRYKVYFCDDANHPFQSFSVSGDRIARLTNPQGCATIQNGNLTAGIVVQAPCNSADVNQRWMIHDGRIFSGRTGPPPAIQPYCLDVRFNSHAIGAELGVAPCNGTEAQAFWISNVTVRMRSTFQVQTGPETCDWECLDLLFDNEVAGTGFDNFNCNGTNAQWFFPYKDHHLHLANKFNLCLGVNGPIGADGVAPVALQDCKALSDAQRWYYVNLPGGGTWIKNMKDNLCLDVTLADPTPGTPVVAYGCNTQTYAQRWSPQRDVPCSVLE